MEGWASSKTLCGHHGRKRPFSGGRVICVDNAYKRVDESCANNVSSAQSLEIRVCVDGCWLWAGENAVNALQERGDPVQPPTLALVRLM